ncbi:MAG: phage tail protein [Chthonomonas sp.]|nr:phage tail protein [Chthonomonas sp.]
MGAATIILGGLGAAVGSTIPGVGTKFGFQVGASLGGMIDQSAAIAGMVNEVGKLSDLRFSGSAYGADIPRVWGRARLGGNLIWAATDASGNHLKQAVKKSGGKGATPTTKTYSYTSTFAMMICTGTLTMPDGTQVKRNLGLRKIWFDGKLVYDSADSDSILFDKVTYYDGDESQAPDPLIVAHEGGVADDVCAHRGMCYVVFDDVAVPGRLPSVEFEIESGSLTYSTVLSDLCRSSGLATGQLSFGTLPTCHGFVQSGRMAIQEPVNGILDFLSCDLVSVNGAMTGVARGGGVVRAIDPLHLGAGNGSPGAKLRKSLPKSRDFPSQVEVQYFDIDADLQAGAQSDRRAEGSIDNQVSFSYPIAMTGAVAQATVRRKMDELWAATDTAEISVPMMYADLIPSDVVTLEGVRYRITNMERVPIGAIRFEMVRERAESLTQVGTPSAGGTGSIAPEVPVPTVFRAWSGVEISDDHRGSAGFYVAGAGAAGWRGATVFYSPDAGTTWIEAGTISLPSVFGVTTSTLSASGAVADTFDTTNTVGVDISASGGVVESTSDADVLAGNNHAIVGSELLGVGVSSLVSANNYTLSRLRRGERGSTMSGHTTGELFVMVGPETVRVAVDAGLVGSSVLVKAVSPYQAMGDVGAVSVTIAAPTPDPIEGAIDALNSSAQYPVFSSGSLASGTAEVTSWTTVTPSGLPSQAKSLIVFAWARNSGSTLTKIRVRTGSGATEHEVLRVKADSDTDENGSQAMIPLSGGGTFQYVVEGPDVVSWEVQLIGYWRTVA